MDGKPLKKEIFLSDQEFLEKVLPAFPRRNARVLEVKEVPSVYDKQVIQVKLDTGEPIDLLNFSFHLTHGDMIGCVQEQRNLREARKKSVVILLSPHTFTNPLKNSMFLNA
jgi:hypothetical protein